MNPLRSSLFAPATSAGGAALPVYGCRVAVRLMVSLCADIVWSNLSSTPPIALTTAGSSRLAARSVQLDAGFFLACLCNSLTSVGKHDSTQTQRIARVAEFAFLILILRARRASESVVDWWVTFVGTSLAVKVNRRIARVVRRLLARPVPAFQTLLAGPRLDRSVVNGKALSGELIAAASLHQA